MIKLFTHSRKWLYLPIEIKVREFEAKILIALLAVKRGYNVVLGSKSNVFRQAIYGPPGIYFYKDISHPMENKFRQLREKGHKIVIHDEEGLVLFSEEIYLNQRIPLEITKLVDCIFAWGRVQETILLKKLPSEQVVRTGHPRFDILRHDLRKIFDEQLQDICKKHGRIILVNTNHAAWNHQRGPEGYINLFKSHDMFKTPEDEEFRYRYQQHVKFLFESYVAAIHRIAKEFPDHTIVVRPHPVENHTVWVDLMKDVANVIVNAEGSVAKWIYAADAVVQTNCTTAIESVVLDTPSYAYLPVTNSEFDSELPNLFSFQSKTEDELIEQLKFGVFGAENYTLREKKRNLLEKYLSALNGQWASSRIMNACDKLDVYPQRYSLNVRGVVLPLLLYFLQKTKNLQAEDDKKMPLTTITEVRQTISQFSKTSPDINSAKVTGLGENLFILHS